MTRRPSRHQPDHLDRRQGIDARQARRVQSRDAAKDGAQVMCFQELFYGPYFGDHQDKKYYRYAESGRRPHRAAVRLASRRSSAS